MSARIRYAGVALSFLVGVLAFAGLLDGNGSVGAPAASGPAAVQIADGPSGSLIWD
ncbi:hypothetical protein [Actinoplanes sp. NPDC026670]|uniref:hypothetical protein n=1 Tax=Actinoplanes sp. NPDC026670 TaxID=3154700 RepID=UPI0033CE8088